MEGECNSEENSGHLVGDNDVSLDENNDRTNHENYTKNTQLENLTQCGSKQKRQSVQNEELTSTDYAMVMKPPDGGWGWLVGLGTSILTMLLFSVAPCFGILFSRFLLDLGTSSTTTAWIFNVQMCIWHIVGPFVGPLCKEFGFRRVGFLGVSLSSSAIIISAFAPSAEFLFFSFSTLNGLGGGLAATSCFLILPTYFEKRRGIANTMLTAGICMSQILGAPLIRYLQDEYAFTGAAMIYGAILMHCYIGVALFHPLKWHMKCEDPDFNVHESNVEPLIPSRDDVNTSPAEDPTSETLREERKIEAKALRVRMLSRFSESSHTSKRSIGSDNQSLIYLSMTAIPEMADQVEDSEETKKSSHIYQVVKRVFCAMISDLKIFRSMRALIINLGIAFCINGQINFLMMVPFKMQEAGFTLQDSAWCISVLGMCNLVTRLIVSPLTDWNKFNMRLCFMIGYGIIAVTIFVFPLLTNLTWITVVIGVTGCGIAANVTLNSLIMIKYMGIENLAPLFGASCLLLGASFIIFGPFIGFIRDITGSYTFSMWIVALMPTCSLILWFFMPAAVSYDIKRERSSTKEKHATP